jgi:hypothetical protein
MGNRRTRAFTLRQQDAADWERVRTATRPAAADVYARGIGLRRLQLIVCPSFSESWAWEVRQRDREWWLFGSRVAAPWPAVQLVGYVPLAADPAMLSGFFERAAGLSLPISPDLSGTGGLDGTVSQLAVFGDMFSECRFQWWSQPPAQWRPLTDLAAEMLAAFAAARSTEGEFLFGEGGQRE